MIVGMVAASVIFTGCGNAAEPAAGSSAAEANADSGAAEINTGSSAASSGTASADENTEDTVETNSDAENYELLTREVFAMDTYMTFSAYGEDAEAALDEAEEEILRLDQLLAAESEDSEVAKLNQNGGGQLSDDTAYLIERSIALNQETDGAFEITVYPVKQAWGFTDENYRIPSDEELAELLPLVGSEQLELDAENKTVAYQKDGMKIDLGGITKGYASSRLTDIFMKHDVQGMINLGGNVQVYGPKPDGSDWRVAIQAPERTEENTLPWLSQAASGSASLAGLDYIGVLETNSQAVITSGGYERYFEKDGVYYHHIIDPKTGYPSDADLVSVTIVSEDGTLADGLSTSMFVLGLDKASEIWRAHSDEFDMILMDTDGNLYVTEGIKDQFTSDLEIHWIE
ncbi:MAG: FAD:protein FMN transferase [Eubacterium sp.]|nr:FAD:protein FMN transferase [Eubacterium sp.]